MILSQKAAISSFSVLSPTRGAPTASTTQRSGSRCAMRTPMQTIEWYMCFGNLSPIAHFGVRAADKIVGRREPGEVGHGFDVPDDDALVHQSCRVVSSELPRTRGRGSGLASVDGFESTRGLRRASGDRRPSARRENHATCLVSTSAHTGEAEQ
jgi:hypothetical protein